MTFFQIILLLSVHNKCGALIWEKNFEIGQTVTDDSVILGEVITNYLIRYFSEDSVFVSIVLGPSTKCRGDRHFHQDFFNELFDNPKLTEFSHNVLDKMDASALDRRNAFNLILVEDSNSLK